MGEEKINTSETIKEDEMQFVTVLLSQIRPVANQGNTVWLLRLLHGNDGRIIIVINYQTRFRGVPFPRALYLTNLRSSRSPKPTFFSDPIAWPSFVPLPSFRTEHASHNSAKTKQSSLFLNLLGLRDGRNARRRFDRRFLRHAASRRHRFGFRRALPRGDRFLGRGRLLRARRLGLRSRALTGRRPGGSARGRGRGGRGDHHRRGRLCRRLRLHRRLCGRRRFRGRLRAACAAPKLVTQVLVRPVPELQLELTVREDLGPSAWTV